MGRKKMWDKRLLLPLTTETLERIDANLGVVDSGDCEYNETRLDLIREAIERELKRRDRRS